MVDEISGIDTKLFQIKTVKKVREVSPRPDKERHGRDTYSESDEIGLLTERDQLRRRKNKRRLAPGGDKVEREDKDEALEMSSRDDHATRHIDIIV